MNAFVFYPELFESRNRLMEELLAADYRWLSSYSSVDIDHERFMLEVCGIQDRADATAMRSVASRAFNSSWFQVWYKDFGIEQGWILEVYLLRANHIQ